MKRPFDPTCEDCCDPLEQCPIHAGDMQSLPEFTIPEDKLAYLIVCDDCGGLGCWKCGWQAVDGFVEGGKGADCSLQRRASSKGIARKAAAAKIAKIPFPLASYIARTFKPRELIEEARASRDPFPLVTAMERELDAGGDSHSETSNG